MNPDDEVFAKAKQLRDAGVPLDEIERYVQSKLGAPSPTAGPAPLSAADSTLHAARLAKAQAIQAEPDDTRPSVVEQGLGTFASLGRDIPGVEAAQAGLAAGFSHLPGLRPSTGPVGYGEALNEIRDAENSAPRAARVGARIIGGGVAALAMPALAEKAAGSAAVASLPKAERIMALVRGAASTPALQGATYGAASGALQADPNAGLGRRALDAGIGAAAGAVTGKLGENLSIAGRSFLSKPLDKAALARQAEMAGADAVNYGRAEAEGRAVGGTTPELEKILSNPSPTLAPYVREVTQNSESLANATPAQRLIEAYKLMSERQGLLERRIVQAAPTDFKAGSALEGRDIGAVKSALQQAASAPSRVTKPPITLDIAPENYSVDPQITPGREALQGPVQEGGLSRVTTAHPDPTLRQALRDFPKSSVPPKAQGPAGPAFQLRGQAERVVPGVDISTPAMRVQTAPPKTIDYPAAMPSLRNAISEHARLSGIDNAAGSGADAARTLIEEPHRGYNKQLQNSASSFFDQLNNRTPWSSPAAPMTADEQTAALSGALGRNREYLSLSLLPKPWFSNNSSNIAPIIRAIDAQRGTPLTVDAFRSIVASQGHPTP